MTSRDFGHKVPPLWRPLLPLVSLEIDIQGVKLGAWEVSRDPESLGGSERKGDALESKELLGSSSGESKAHRKASSWEAARLERQP